MWVGLVSLIGPLFGLAVCGALVASACWLLSLARASRGFIIGVAVLLSAGLIASEVIPARIAASIVEDAVQNSPRAQATSLMVPQNVPQSAAGMLIDMPFLRFTESNVDFRVSSPFERLPVGIIKFQTPREVEAPNQCRDDEVWMQRPVPGKLYSEARRTICVSWEQRPNWSAEYSMPPPVLREEPHGPWTALVQSRFLLRRADDRRFNELRDVAITGGIGCFASRWFMRVASDGEIGRPYCHAADANPLIAHLGELSDAARNYRIGGQR